MVPPPIGLEIKRARERMRLSQAQLGTKVGVSQKTIDNWEHDRTYPKSSIGALEAELHITLTGPAVARPAIPAGLRRYLAALDPEDREWVIEELRKVTGPSEDLADDDHEDDAKEEL